MGLGSWECSAGGGDIVLGVAGFVEWTFGLLMGDCVNSYVEASTLRLHGGKNNVTCELGAAGTSERLHRKCRTRGVHLRLD